MMQPLGIEIKPFLVSSLSPVVSSPSQEFSELQTKAIEMEIWDVAQGYLSRYVPQISLLYHVIDTTPLRKCSEFL